MIEIGKPNGALIYLILWTLPFMAIPSAFQQNKSVGFVENKGQVVDTKGNVRNEIKYLSEINGQNSYFSKSGISYVLAQKKESVSNFSDAKSNREMTISTGYSLQRIDLEFIDASENVNIIPGQAIAGVSNYFLPHCSKGIMNVMSYGILKYENIYPNIDIVFYQNKNGLEYDIHVKPGGKVSDIQMEYKGAEKLKIIGEKLHIYTTTSNMEEYVPMVYQKDNPQKISAAYIVKSDVVSFDVGKYDAYKELVIDPWVTYFGGNSSEYTYDICSYAGNIYITGYTYSNVFPVSAGAYQLVKNGGADVFIAKSDASGNRLWSTYYGGSDEDYAYSICDDGSGNILLTGITYSGDFPNTAGFFQGTNRGGADAFLLKLNDNNGYPAWATYYGGTGDDYGYSVSLAPGGDILIAGSTTSANIPITISTFQTVNKGSTDAFVARINGAGTSQVWSAYCGGTVDDYAYGVKADIAGNVIIAGFTGSVDFPVAAAFQPTYRGPSSDIFVTKLNSNGGLIWSTYLGGSDEENSQGVDVTTDSQNNVIVVGNTLSVDFPVSSNAFQSVFASLGGAGEDAFIFKFDGNGNRKWSTFYGGNGQEWCSGVTVDASDQIYITGDTYSADLPVTSGAYQSQSGGFQDYYMAKFNPDGNQVCATYLGGSDVDIPTHGGGITVDNSLIYITGSTPEADFPVTNGSILKGPYDAFIAQFCSNCSASVDIIASSNTTVCYGNTVTITAGGATDYTWSPATGLNVSTGAGVIAQPLVSTIYKVFGTIGGGCQDSAFITVEVRPIPSFQVAVSNLVPCYGSSSDFSIDSLTNSYTWSPGLYLNATTGTNVTSAPTTIGVHQYTVTGTNTFGCINSSFATIEVMPTPIIQLTADSVICDGDTTMLLAQTDLLSSYTWSPQNLLTSTSGNTTNTIPLTTGNYMVYLTASDILNNCSANDSARILVISSVVVNVGIDETICAGDSITLNVTGAASYYNWTPANSLNKTSGSSVMATPSLATSYVVKAFAGTCQGTDTVIVSINSLPIINFTADDTTVCEAFCVLFTNTTLNSLNCTWDYGDGTIFNGCTNSQHCYINQGEYNVKLKITDNNTCVDSLTKINWITVYSKPNADFSANPASTSINNPIIYFTDRSTGNSINHWQWEFGNTNEMSDDQNPNHTYSDTGNYQVRLIISDTNQCMDTSINYISIMPEFLFYVPNTFTPNEDGKNDVFIPSVIGVVNDEFELIITDRWGNVVLESNQIQLGWDGKIRGSFAQEDIYEYKIKVKDINGIIHQYLGHIVLLR